MTKLVDQDQITSKKFVWTIERYERAIETGIFTEDDKIELLYGEIVESMPSEAEHEYCITLLAKFFRRLFGEKYQLREEKSLVLANEISLPEPDLVVVEDHNYSKRKPSVDDVHLVAEVSNSSLDRDRIIKMTLYAEAGLPEYWIVNLQNRQIEVYLRPDSTQGIYESLTIHKEGTTFTSPFAGEVVVAELLPDAE